MTDFVLVWEESVNPLKSAESDEEAASSSRDTHRKWRSEFLSRLQTAGLHQETVHNLSEICVERLSQLRKLQNALLKNIAYLILEIPTHFYTNFLVVLETDHAPLHMKNCSLWEIYREWKGTTLQFTFWSLLINWFMKVYCIIQYKLFFINVGMANSFFLVISIGLQKRFNMLIE